MIAQLDAVDSPTLPTQDTDYLRFLEALKAAGFEGEIAPTTPAGCSPPATPSSTLTARFWPEIGTCGLRIQLLSAFRPNFL